ncbi:MAG: preprotein translocase subunit YajC [Oscillospiraceae bacterium]|jgi:preprotein translocase subunit YajC|nr:preprotein translocase subunit YajC [Oscillospiraceae bacterium]
MFFSRVNPLWMLAEAVTGSPEAGDVAAQGGVLGMIFSFAPILLIGVVFYFMLIRPQRKKDKKVKDMLSNLKVGDRVTTIGGIHGTVTSLKDDNLTIAVGADKVKLVFARWGIRSVDDVSISNDSETLI